GRDRAVSIQTGTANPWSSPPLSRAADPVPGEDICNVEFACTARRVGPGVAGGKDEARENRRPLRLDSPASARRSGNRPGAAGITPPLGNRRTAVPTVAGQFM